MCFYTNVLPLKNILNKKLTVYEFVVFKLIIKLYLYLFAIYSML